ncbi:MAG TPA: D-alanyl-D-alanine carboxypeptidase family protein [Kofleriaceae bacterium]|nr:D-alanyl-D-alanine carboxypeptidase family protein [Kofleriaceae bacterium]
MRVIVALLVCMGIAHADSRVERGYKHGKPFKIRVTTIGWAEVEVQTAKAFKRMARAAEQAGVELSIRSGFRSHDRQQMLYRAFKEGWGNKAARPGFSNHESGRALDIYMTDKVGAWMRRHARRFGFKQTVRGEPWHWEYTPPRATARASSKRRRP